MRVWLFFAALAALIGFLYTQFPGALKTSDDRFHLFYMTVLALMVGGGAIASRKRNWSRDAMFAVWWILIALALVFGYSFRHDISRRLIGELVPSRAQTVGNAVVLRRAADGHFHVQADVNNTPISFLIDTGASDVTLTLEDAHRLGFRPVDSEYTRSYRTANGVVSGAPVALNQIVLKDIFMSNVQASINKSNLDESLLGMSFLNRLQSFKIEGDVLTLQP